MNELTALSDPLSAALLAGGVVAVVAALIFFLSRSNWQKRLQQLEAQEAEAQLENARLAEQLEQAEQIRNQLESESQQLQTQQVRLDERLNYQERLLDGVHTEKRQLEKRLEQVQFQLADRSEVVAELETRLEAERQAQAEKIKTLEQAKVQLTQEFENLANRIFDEKTKRFNEASQQSMGQLVTPLREQLGEFKRRIDDVYDKESKDRRALHEQITHLKQLNQQMSSDAINLTNALKGDNKTQGNWGEVVLERALEESGLRKGYEFELQFSTSQEGRRYQPDAVIHLPDGKDVIVDAKMSLRAYEQYCSTEDTQQKALYLREHLLSMRGHIKGLSDKAYQGLENIRSLDFVLQFIPVEGAFLLALEKEPGLFKEAFDRNIILVSPATLMVTLRTIHNIWRYEHQSQNAKEIARRGGELHDKFVGFVEALDDVGRHIERSQQAFDTAHKRLVSGRGNLVSQVAMLQKLGADGRKQLADNLLDKAQEEESS